MGAAFSTLCCSDRNELRPDASTAPIEESEAANQMSISEKTEVLKDEKRKYGKERKKKEESQATESTVDTGSAPSLTTVAEADENTVGSGDAASLEAEPLKKDDISEEKNLLPTNGSEENGMQSSGQVNPSSSLQPSGDNGLNGDQAVISLTEDAFINSEEDKERARKTRETMKDSRSANEGDEHVKEYLTTKEKDYNLRSLLKICLKKDRVCQILDVGEMDAIVDTMDCFQFRARDVVVKQGDQGTYFFVTQEGELEVTMDGSVVNTLYAGDSFGGLALLHKCPRTATVTAKTDATLWGVPGHTFQKVIADHSEKHREKNRAALERVKLFSGFPESVKDQVASILTTEIVENGARVFTEGETATAMYFVKTGKLAVNQGGAVGDDGVLAGGTEISKLGPGDYFGERAVLSSEVRSKTVVASERSELICLCGHQIKEVLHMDLRSCLDRHVNLTGLRASPIFFGLTSSQQVPFLQSIVVADFTPGQVIDEAFHVFLSVIEGEVTLEFGDEKKCLSEREFNEMDWAKTPEEQQEVHLQAVRKTSKKTIGAAGARLGILTEDGLVKAMRQLGLSFVSDFEKAEDILPKFCMVSKVPIFRNLSQYQLGMVADALNIKIYRKGDEVVKKGEIGTSFFIVQSGHLDAVAEGNHVLHTLGRHEFFGERALILEEPRNATVVVSSDEAVLECVEKTAIAGVITDKLKADLHHRLAMEDTSMELKDLRPIRIIGKGEWGVVRLVECVPTGVMFSLKRVNRLANGELPVDAKREHSLLTDVSSPFIVHVVKTFDTARSMYILSEIVTGGSFRAALLKKGRALQQSEAQFYAGCLTLVLQTLYEQHIIHRDLKPENLLLDLEGYPKVIDFAQAKKLRSSFSRAFTLFGTPHYMAPEVIQGRGYGMECDLWSFGVIVYEMMYNRLPFGADAKDPVKVWEEVVKAELVFPSSFTCNPAENLLRGVLTVDPKRRLGSGAAGLDDVRRSEFFKDDNGKTEVFEGLMGRTLKAPLEPHSLTERIRFMIKNNEVSNWKSTEGKGYTAAKKDKKNVLLDVLKRKDETVVFSDAEEFHQDVAQ